MNKLLQDLLVSDVLTVYSGKVGKCMCGCAGTHYANPEHVSEAEKARGYSYDPEHVSKAMVQKVLRLVQAEEPDGKVDYSREWVAADVGKRTYTVYLRSGVTVSLEKDSVDMAPCDGGLSVAGAR